jgi:hypothetical protein
MRRERKEAIWRIVYYLVGFAIGVLAGLRMESCHTHPTPDVQNASPDGAISRQDVSIRGAYSTPPVDETAIDRPLVWRDGEYVYDESVWRF